MYGLNRSLGVTVHSIDEKILRPLKSVASEIYSYAAFNVTASGEFSSKRSGEGLSRIADDQQDLLPGFQIQLVDQDDFDAGFKLTDVLIFGDHYQDDGGSVLNMMRALHALKSCYGSIPLHARQSFPTIFVRPDLDIIDDLDIVLDASVDNEADPLGIVPTSSTTLTLSIGDALAGVLMSIKGFNKNDFARYHPSGSLGKRLLLTVENIMQQISNVAVVNMTDKLRKVVIAMTEKPNGAAIVKCKNDEFGLITDGDLRRCLAEGEDIDLLDAEKIMTNDPVSISSNSSVDNALKLMEDRRSQISVLPVVSIENGECLGLIRLHDIYQTRLL